MRDELKELRALRKEAGAKIDPDTARVIRWYGQILDPYGDHDDLHLEHDCVGSLHFASSPEPGSMWVSFDDLPQQTVELTSPEA